MEENDVFTNRAVELNEIPRIETENFQKLNSEYRSLIIVARFIFIAFLLAAGAILYRVTDLEIWHIYTPLSLFAILSLFLAWLGYNKKGYLLREKDISYRTGLIFHHITTVPLVRIQHSEVSQGPLQRLFDLATVKIYTAGGSTSDIAIPGLHPEDAQKIKEYINQMVHDNATT